MSDLMDTFTVVDQTLHHFLTTFIPSTIDQEKPLIKEILNESDIIHIVNKFTPKEPPKHNFSASKGEGSVKRNKGKFGSRHRFGRHKKSSVDEGDLKRVEDGGGDKVVCDAEGDIVPREEPRLEYGYF